MQIARTWTKRGRRWAGGRAWWLSLLALQITLSCASSARASCGDGLLESALETCDDGNVVAGGCSLPASGGSASAIGWLLATLIITSLLARRARPRVPRSKRRRHQHEPPR